VSLGDAWGICIICILLKNVLNYKRYCGWDIHKDSILPKNFKTEIKQFATTTEEVEELKVWLKSHPVGWVVMENTGIYTMPIWRLLENDFYFEVGPSVFNQANA